MTMLHAPRRTPYDRGQGPVITALGGGTGLSTMLRGLKRYTENLTAIVTVADDGGGSGTLRQDLGMPPPGDIRNCMEALANAEPVMRDLLSYRFPANSGRLGGQSMGNLILAALNEISPSFDQAVARLGEVLALTGRVLPVTNENVRLIATFENGTHVVGESRIFQFKKEQDCHIRAVQLLPENPPALPATLSAIAEADILLLGPGSLYTSVIPNLLVEGVAEAIRASKALKIYVCNIMTQDGETEGMGASEHVAALLAHGGQGLVDVCLCNSEDMPQPLLERYLQEGAVPLKADWEGLDKLGVEVIERPLCDKESNFARHAPEHLARAILDLFWERNVRVAPEKPGTTAPSIKED